MNFIITQYKLIIFFLTLIFLSVIFFYFSIIESSINCNSECEFVIENNEMAYHIAHKLDSLGFINNPNLFIIASKILFVDKDIKPGIYDLSKAKNIRNLLNIITVANNDYIKVTIPEGWNIDQVAIKLNEKDLINIKIFSDLCTDIAFIESMGLSGISSLEGFLYPETYFLSSIQTDKQIIETMVDQFKKVMSIENISKNKYNFSLHQIITFASIVQGESMLESEMKTIASVFHNRINKNMFLDANATIQYVIPGKNRRLRNKDLEIKSPYNTYKNKHLPPGPINSPGISAIRATLEPEKTNYLYFVKENINSRKHIFSSNIRAHEKARKIYLKSLK